MCGFENASYLEIGKIYLSQGCFPLVFLVQMIEAPSLLPLYVFRTGYCSGQMLFSSPHRHDPVFIITAGSKCTTEPWGACMHWRRPPGQGWNRSSSEFWQNVL